MVTLSDKYIGGEGANFVFAEIDNCDFEARPSRTGFKSQDFWLRKRDGVETPAFGDLGSEVQSSILFNQRILTYTEDGFLFSFDGIDIESYNPFVGQVTLAGTGSTLAINQEASKFRQLQEFRYTSSSAIVDTITVRMRSTAPLSSGFVMSCNLVEVTDKDTIIYQSNNTISEADIGLTYSNNSFYFSNAVIDKTKTYGYYLECTSTSNSEFIELEASNANLFPSLGSFWHNGNAWIENTGFNITSTVSIGTATDYDDSYDDEMVSLSYLADNFLPANITENEIATYDKPNSKITFVADIVGPSDPTLIGKYAYVMPGSDGARQWAAIVDMPTLDTIEISSSFPVDVTAGGKIEIYSKIKQQVLIPRLRDPSDPDKVMSLTEDGTFESRYFPESKKIVFRDNRVVSLRRDAQAIVMYQPGYVEIPSLNIIDFGGQEALNIVPFGTYLLCFFRNKTGIVRRVVDSTGEVTGYVYQDLINTGIFSKEAYLIEGSDLYIFSNSKRLYSVSIGNITLSDVDAKLEDQSFTLESYFDSFKESGEIHMSHTGSKLRVVYKDDDVTQVFKYIPSYQMRVRDTYNFAGNFMNRLYNINDRRISLKDSGFVTFGGITDLGEQINQRIKVYGPVQGKMSTFSREKTKLRIGFDSINSIGGRIIGCVGGHKKSCKVYNLSDLDVIQEINQVLSLEGTIGEPVVGQYTIGGTEVTGISEVYPEFLDVGFNVGLKGQYLTMEIINDEEHQLYLNTIMPIYNTESELIISNKGVIPGTPLSSSI